MHHKGVSSALAALSVIVFSSVACGQAVRGSLLGTVTDSSGAVVPNAKVPITEMNTGISRSSQTNDSGNYMFPALEPGEFRVTVEQTGFRTGVKEGVRVLVNTSFVFNSGAAGRPDYQKFGKNSDALLRYAGYSNNYNSLQVKLDRRFSGGFLMTTAYTWGKALGYSSGTGGLWNYIDQRRSYSLLDFDRAHNFGRVTSTLAGLIANQGVGGTGPRAIPLGLKISF